MSFIPIVLIAYNRPWHTEQTLNALQKNLLANQSKLIVFIDGPKKDATPEELKKIEEVKQVVEKEQWCKSVEVRVSKENRGCRYGPIYGISTALEEHDSVIILEDDIITSKYFLTYMNKALTYYSSYKSVFSISGYNFPPSKLQIPSDYIFDVCISLRQKNWGWGTWRDRWQQVEWDKDFIPNFLANKEQREAFNRGGDDLSKMLQEEYEGKSDAWDIQFSFAQFKHHAVSIAPCISYTNNIGLDNSGTHTLLKTHSAFYNDLSKCQSAPKLLDVLYQDKRIINALYSCYYPKKRSVWKKVINNVSRKLGYNSPFMIKRKVYV